LAKLLPAPEARASIRVLVIDDAVDDVKRIRDLLHREGDFRVQSARDVAEARVLLDEGNHDAAVIDYRLWSDDSRGLVRFVRERHSDVAVGCCLRR
jgi:DNA-binding NtrC family response regulator